MPLFPSSNVPNGTQPNRPSPAAPLNTTSSSTAPTPVPLVTEGGTPSIQQSIGSSVSPSFAASLVGTIATPAQRAAAIGPAPSENQSNVIGGGGGPPSPVLQQQGNPALSSTASSQTGPTLSEPSVPAARIVGAPTESAAQYYAAYDTLNNQINQQGQGQYQFNQQGAVTSAILNQLPPQEQQQIQNGTLTASVNQNGEVTLSPSAGAQIASNALEGITSRNINNLLGVGNYQQPNTVISSSISQQGPSGQQVSPSPLLPIQLSAIQQGQVSRGLQAAQGQISNNPQLAQEQAQYKSEIASAQQTLNSPLVGYQFTVAPYSQAIAKYLKPLFVDNFQNSGYGSQQASRAGQYFVNSLAGLPLLPIGIENLLTNPIGSLESQYNYLSQAGPYGLLGAFAPFAASLPLEEAVLPYATEPISSAGGLARAGLTRAIFPETTRIVFENPENLESFGTAEFPSGQQINLLRGTTQKMQPISNLETQISKTVQANPDQAQFIQVSPTADLYNQLKNGGTGYVSAPVSFGKGFRNLFSNDEFGNPLYVSAPNLQNGQPISQAYLGYAFGGPESEAIGKAGSNVAYGLRFSQTPITPEEYASVSGQTDILNNIRQAYQNGNGGSVIPVAQNFYSGYEDYARSQGQPLYSAPQTFLENGETEAVIAPGTVISGTPDSQLNTFIIRPNQGIYQNTPLASIIPTTQRFVSQGASAQPTLLSNEDLSLLSSAGPYDTLTASQQGYIASALNSPSTPPALVSSINAALQDNQLLAAYQNLIQNNYTSTLNGQPLYTPYPSPQIVNSALALGNSKVNSQASQAGPTEQSLFGEYSAPTNLINSNTPYGELPQYIDPSVSIPYSQLLELYNSGGISPYGLQTYGSPYYEGVLGSPYDYDYTQRRILSPGLDGYLSTYWQRLAQRLASQSAGGRAYTPSLISGFLYPQENQRFLSRYNPTLEPSEPISGLEVRPVLTRSQNQRLRGPA
jgi:hypothetical protein